LKNKMQAGRQRFFSRRPDNPVSNMDDFIARLINDTPSASDERGVNPNNPRGVHAGNVT